MKKLNRMIAVLLAMVIALGSLSLCACAEGTVTNVVYNPRTHVLSWSWDGDPKADNYEVNANHGFIETRRTSLNISKMIKDVNTDEPLSVLITAYDKDYNILNECTIQINLQEPAKDTGFLAKLADFFMDISVFFNDLFAPRPSKIG